MIFWHGLLHLINQALYTCCQNVTPPFCYFKDTFFFLIPKWDRCQLWGVPFVRTQCTSQQQGNKTMTWATLSRKVTGIYYVTFRSTLFFFCKQLLVKQVERVTDRNARQPTCCGDFKLRLLLGNAHKLLDFREGNDNISKHCCNPKYINIIRWYIFSVFIISRNASVRQVSK